MFAFDTHTPVGVPISSYYFERLRDGSLLPADERTATLAGVSFGAADDAQAKARDTAKTRWKAQTGTDLPALDAAVEETP